MKLQPNNAPAAQVPGMRQRGSLGARAFTMIEIAIALGVIAVALIAIMGVLPSGMQVQRDNRQDTIINSDGAYLLEAIRHSAMGLPDLTNFVEYVDGSSTVGMTNGEVIQRMSEPNGPHRSVLHAITGPAALRAPGVPTFRYLVVSDVMQLDPTQVNPELPYLTNLAPTLFEVRLAFLWPLLPNSTNLAPVSQKQVMRTLVSGYWDITNHVFNLAEVVP